MGNSRRTFLKNSALVTAAAGLFPGRTFANPKTFVAPTKKDYVGVQLYSVRDAMTKDPAGSCKKLADIGYRYVEHAGYRDGKFYGMAPKDFKVMLDGLGLKMVSGHCALTPQHWDAAKSDFTDVWKQTVTDAAVAGQEYVISPWIDESLYKNYDDLLRWLNVFNKSGELCKTHGLKFGYHNHWFEFNHVLNGKKMYDIILQNTDPALVAQQLDMGNLYNGDAIAIAVVMQYPGRFELMHVKDEIASKGSNEKYESTILGKGIVGTRQVCDQGRKTGTRWFIIEQESYQSMDPFDSCKDDLDIMKKWGY